MGKLFITSEEAIALLPDAEYIHTFYNMPFSLIGADWSKEEVIKKLKASDKIEITGTQARCMGHGLAVYNSNIKWHSDVLFVETNMELLDKLYPPEAESEM